MKLFKVSDMSHEFVGKSLLKKAELMVHEGEYIRLVGPNG